MNSQPQLTIVKPNMFNSVVELDVSINGVLKQLTPSPSCTLSKRYMNIVVSSSIINILYQRIPIDKSQLKINEIFEGVPFVKLVDSKSKDPIVSTFMKWRKGIKHAIKRNFLKEVYVFLKDGNTKDMLEFYRFKLNYNSSNDEVNSMSQAEIKKKTLDLLSAINRLGKHEKLKCVTLSIELTYFDHTPWNYEPPTFVPAQTRTPTRVASHAPNTGLQSGTCHAAKAAPLGESSPSKSLDRTISSDLTRDSSFSSLGSDSDTEIDCMCDLPVSLDVPLVTCSKCTISVHAPCYGYFDVYEGEFTCNDCQPYDPSLKATDLVKMQALARFRLTLYFLKVTGKVDRNVIGVDQEIVWKLLDHFKVIRDDESVDKEVVSSIIDEYSKQNIH